VEGGRTSLLDDVLFWNQVVQDSRRTLLVSRDVESRAIEMVKAHGLDHVVTVKVSSVLPEGVVYLVDELGIEANLRETLQQYRPAFATPAYRDRYWMGRRPSARA
jgi:hypothetical protein